MPLPQRRARPESEPERRLLHLQSRFRKVSSRLSWPRRIRRLAAGPAWSSTAITLLAVAIAAIGLLPWPCRVSAGISRHSRAVPPPGPSASTNPAVASWLLAALRRGPDGIACEWGATVQGSRLLLPCSQTRRTFPTKARPSLSCPPAAARPPARPAARRHQPVAPAHQHRHLAPVRPAVEPHPDPSLGPDIGRHEEPLRIGPDQPPWLPGGALHQSESRPSPCSAIAKTGS